VYRLPGPLNFNITPVLATKGERTLELSWAEFPDLTLLIRRLHAGDKDAESQFFRVGYHHPQETCGHATESRVIP